MNSIIREVTEEQLQSNREGFKVGDGVRVHTKVREGGKERVQVFAGIVICRRGSGIHATFTVRRISHGEGVERVFPTHSPNISRIEVDRESVVKRARMYFIRKRVGRQAVKVDEKRNRVTR